MMFACIKVETKCFAYQMEMKPLLTTEKQNTAKLKQISILKLVNAEFMDVM